MSEKTVEELLTRWDAGESVWTIEMGGLGPGYEQALQILAIEMIRDCKDAPLPESEFGSWGDATVTRLDKSCGGFSGAQVGVAKQIAYRFIKMGPEAAMRDAEPDRKIMVSQFWPKVA